MERAAHRKSFINSPEGHLASDIVEAAKDCDPSKKGNRQVELHCRNSLLPGDGYQATRLKTAVSLG